MRPLLGLLFSLSLSAATVDDIKIHWTSTGEGEGTVVLVHGWTGDSSVWSAQVQALAAKHRVNTFDLPGDHFLMMEKSDEFNRLPLSFLGKLK